MQELVSLPFVTAPERLLITVEVNAYLALGDAVVEADNLCAFWLRHKAQLPILYTKAMIAALIQPSSGCVERVFSLLRNLFNDRQDHTLQDYVQGSVMLAYNEKQRSVEVSVSLSSLFVLFNAFLFLSDFFLALLCKVAF